MGNGRTGRATHAGKVTTYAEAVAFLNGQQSRKLTNNTFVQQTHRVTDHGVVNAYAVRLHDTDVVTFHADGSITLDTGGYVTATTLDRMHACTPASVRVSGHTRGKLAGEWSVSHGVGGYAEIPAGVSRVTIPA